MSEILSGRIIKGIGGFYYVKTADSLIECRARGKFRHEKVTPLVGDYVNISENYVIEIMPRKSELIRPKVSNVDQAIITFSVKNPNINLEVLDRFLILTAKANVNAIICINKVDLLNKKKLEKGEDKLTEIIEIYKNSGSKIMPVSVKTNKGIEDLKSALLGKTTVFAGPSGVGKSSIINLLSPELALKTGEISKKIARGKHTTREATLIEISDNTYIVDTPGFTSLNLNHIKTEELEKLFQEFAPFLELCSFTGCKHLNEQTKDCAIKSNVPNKINEKRYDCYVRTFNELKELEDRQYD